MMDQVATIKEIKKNSIWEHQPDLLPVFSQAVRLISSCPQCQE